MNEKNFFCYVMVAPALLMTTVLGIWPLFRTMAISFQEYDLLARRDGTTNWVGFENYRDILGDPRFVQTIYQTVIFTVVAIAIVVTISLFLSHVINAKFRGRAVLRTLIFAPWFVPPVVAAAIWMWFLNANTSPINALLMEWGWINRNIRFLTETDTVGPFSLPMMSIIAVRVWNGIPFVVIFLLAGLQSIDKSQYEAAEIDGAGIWSKFWHITLPSLRPVLLILLALLFMGGFGHFEMNYIMTGGGPRNLTNVLAVWTYQESFQFLRYDRSAAASGIILMMTSVVAIFYLWAQTRGLKR
ncbi:sugar ABC transporter permease [Gymnodinialimonas sp. 2305UL16-5]|uniref:carbohydrate ABC transporter permease n=1 Tax=Gymnodinialimonas mytili TaxID=3126503 RepID=UPI0030A49135